MGLIYDDADDLLCGTRAAVKVVDHNLGSKLNGGLHHHKAVGNLRREKEHTLCEPFALTHVRGRLAYDDDDDDDDDDLR